MARKLKLLPGHSPMNDDTMDRLSVGPDNNIYIDNKKVITQDFFDAFKRASRTWQIVAGIGALVTFTGSVLGLIATFFVINDRVCIVESLVAEKSKSICEKKNLSDAKLDDGKTGVDNKGEEVQPTLPPGG